MSSSAADRQKAALLVDWENFRGALTRKGLDVGKQQVRELIAAVGKLAEERGANLYYESAFMAASSLKSEADVLQGGGLSTELSRSAKNAADTKLTVALLRLCLRQGYSLFFIVSGDVDYVDLADAVEEEGATCILMPLDDTNLRREVLDWEPKQYISGLVEFPKQEQVTVSELDPFLLLLQVLACEHGSVGYMKAQDILGSKLTGGTAASERLWETAKSPQQRLLLQGERIPGRKATITRPRYEAPELLKLLLCADAVLMRVDRRPHGCSVDEIVAEVGHDGLEPKRERVLALISTLEQAGLVLRMGDRLALAPADAGKGYLLPLCQMVLYAWGQALKRDWQMVGRGVLGSSWAKWRARRGADYEQLKREGISVANAAFLAGLLDELKDGKDRGLAPRWEHPLAAFTKQAVVRVICRLHEETLQERSTIPYDGFVRTLGSETNRTRLMPGGPLAEFWVWALSREGHVKVFQPDGESERVIQLSASSRLVEEVLATECVQH